MSRILLAQPKPSPDWYPQELADARRSLLIRQADVLELKAPVVTTGEMWAIFSAERGPLMSQWVDWLLNGQRPAHRITGLILDEPWIGKLTADLVGAFLAARVPVRLWQHGEPYLAPPTAAPWDRLAPGGLLDVPGPCLAIIRGIAHPVCPCGCRTCKIARAAGSPPEHSWIGAGVMGESSRANQPQKPQRPYEVHLGGYCLAVDQAHAKRLESWRPPEDA